MGWKRLLLLLLCILLLSGAWQGFKDRPHIKEPAIAAAQKHVRRFLRGRDWKDFKAMLDISLEESMDQIGQDARLSGKLDLAEMEDADTGSSSGSSARQESKSVKSAAKTIKKTDKTVEESIEKEVFVLASFLPSWIPFRPYLVLIGVLALLLWLIVLANRYVK